jgi:hypothetical protein
MLPTGANRLVKRATSSVKDRCIISVNFRSDNGLNAVDDQEIPIMKPASFPAPLTFSRAQHHVDGQVFGVDKTIGTVDPPILLLFCFFPLPLPFPFVLDQVLASTSPLMVTAVLVDQFPALGPSGNGSNPDRAPDRRKLIIAVLVHHPVAVLVHLYLLILTHQSRP